MAKPWESVGRASPEHVRVGTPPRSRRSPGEHPCVLARDQARDYFRRPRRRVCGSGQQSRRQTGPHHLATATGWNGRPPFSYPESRVGGVGTPRAEVACLTRPDHRCPGATAHRLATPPAYATPPPRCLRRARDARRSRGGRLAPALVRRVSPWRTEGRRDGPHGRGPTRLVGRASLDAPTALAAATAENKWREQSGPSSKHTVGGGVRG